eukprot:6699019-Pyramimonas_sp.AAC.1
MQEHLEKIKHDFQNIENHAPRSDYSQKTADEYHYNGKRSSVLSQRSSATLRTSNPRQPRTSSSRSSSPR